MVRSWALLFSKKKLLIFIFQIILWLYMIWHCEKMTKKVVMLVFLGTKRSWEFFWVFKKKSKKSEKMRFFRKKAYGLTPIFTKSRIIICRNKIIFFWSKKNVKKKRFSFFETFFLKWKLDIYFCPFLKLKKKFWKQKNLPFSPSRWNIWWNGE
jgi:hypothetical protein